jgi:hypothetical protein
MGERNGDIHVFIMEEDRRRNRERALREMAEREKLREPSEELKRALQESSGVPESAVVPEEPVEKEAASLDEGSQLTCVESESDVGVVEQVEHVDMGSCWIKPLEVGSLGFGIDKRAVAISTVVYACSLVSAAVILWLNVVVTRDFPVYGLEFSFEWATPYRMVIITALGMLGVTAVAELFQIYVLAHRRKEKAADMDWKAYVLPDGSAIRVKTLVKEVKRLDEHASDGKPIYAVKADNLVEVVDISETL